MPASYPNEIFDPREIENVSGVSFEPTKKNRFYADDLNNTNNEIVAIEETLGENPEGDFDSVVLRLENIESRVPLSEIVSRPALDNNTAGNNFDLATPGLYRCSYYASVQDRAGITAPFAFSIDYSAPGGAENDTSDLIDLNVNSHIQGSFFFQTESGNILWSFDSVGGFEGAVVNLEILLEYLGAVPV